MVQTLGAGHYYRKCNLNTILTGEIKRIVLGILKEIAKKIPILRFLYRALHDGYVRYQLKLKSTEDIFTAIYRSNKWRGKDSVSGPGSDTNQTRIIVQELPNLFADFNISTMLDIPCGDFHWMKDIDLNSINYTGADIVESLIHENSEKYTNERRRFQHLNLIKDNLPKVDLVFCRDCLVHFSFVDVFLAFNNICNSQSEYLLTTTFTKRQDNGDIATGHWRVLNLQIAPFALPSPLRIIHEMCTECNDAYEDKALGLWRIADIRESLTRCCT